MTDTMWKYEQLRAGKIYNQVMFNTREEAESFAAQMTRVEPDLFWRIEPVEARLWWNWNVRNPGRLTGEPVSHL